MPAIPERERIALNLEEKASNERRKRKDEAMKQFQRSFMPSPSRGGAGSSSPSINDKLSSMSPAARRLLEAKLNIRTSSAGASGSSGLATPSPGKFSAASPSPRVLRSADRFGITTPGTSGSTIGTPTSSSSFKSPSVKISTQSIENLKMNLKRPAPSDSSLTDNLLKLPKNN